MGNIISEGLEYIGRIDDNGYVYNKAWDRVAQITDKGYITEVGGGELYGKIDEDGTIRDASLAVVGRIQADGYVYIHSKRICRVSSVFIERITPEAWNAGDPSSYSGRKKTKKNRDVDVTDSLAFRFFNSSFFIKLVIGIILGVVAMVNGWGGAGMLIAGPVIVFGLCFFAKIFG